MTLILAKDDVLITKSGFYHALVETLSAMPGNFDEDDCIKEVSEYIVTICGDQEHIDFLRRFVEGEQYAHFPTTTKRGQKWIIVNYNNIPDTTCTLPMYIDGLYQILDISCYLQYSFHDDFIEFAIEKVLLTKNVAMECEKMARPNVRDMQKSDILKTLAKLLEFMPIIQKIQTILGNLSNTKYRRIVNDEMLVWLSWLMTISELDASENTLITYNSIKYNGYLEKLNAKNNPAVTDCCLFANPNIRILDVSGTCSITNKGIMQLMYLENLDARCNHKITDDGFKDKTTLTSLHYCINNPKHITNNSINLLSNLTVLMLLDECSCRCVFNTRINDELTDDGLQNKPLVELGIPFCTKITDNALKNKQLTYLNARGCPYITKNGIAHMKLDKIITGNGCGIDVDERQTHRHRHIHGSSRKARRFNRYNDEDYSDESYDESD